MDIALLHALIFFTLVSDMKVLADKYIKEIKEKSMKKCNNIASRPFFSPEMVTGQTWRIYYDWHMWLESKCVEMEFKAVTKDTVLRIYNDMSEHLDEEPAWPAATMLVMLGQSKHELLLFADQGPEGRYVGVLNVAKDGRHAKRIEAVPLMRFQLKVFEKGRYLVMMDCALGTGSLSVRTQDPAPTREDIDKLVEVHNIADGRHACDNHGPGLSYVTINYDITKDIMKITGGL